MSTFLIQFIDANQTQNCNLIFPTKTNFSLCRLWKKFTNRKQFWNKRLAQILVLGIVQSHIKKGNKNLKKTRPLSRYLSGLTCIFSNFHQRYLILRINNMDITFFYDVALILLKFPSPYPHQRQIDNVEYFKYSRNSITLKNMSQYNFSGQKKDSVFSRLDFRNSAFG